MSLKQINALIKMWTEWNKRHEKAMKGDNASAIECEKLILQKYVLIDAIDKEFENAVKKYRRNH